MRNGFSVEVNNLVRDEQFPIINAVSFDIPGDNIAKEKLIEWFSVDLSKLMDSNDVLVRGTTLTPVELGDVVNSAWSEDEFPFINELMARCRLIKLD